MMEADEIREACHRAFAAANAAGDYIQVQPDEPARDAVLALATALRYLAQVTEALAAEHEQLREWTESEINRLAARFER